MHSIKHFPPLAVLDDGDSFSVVLPQSHEDTSFVLSHLFATLFEAGFTVKELVSCVESSFIDHFFSHLEDYANEAASD